MPGHTVGRIQGRFHSEIWQERQLILENRLRHWKKALASILQCKPNAIDHINNLHFRLKQLLVINALAWCTNQERFLRVSACRSLTHQPSNEVQWTYLRFHGGVENDFWQKLQLDQWKKFGKKMAPLFQFMIHPRYNGGKCCIFKRLRKHLSSKMNFWVDTHCVNNSFQLTYML